LPKQPHGGLDRVATIETPRPSATRLRWFHIGH